MGNVCFPEKCANVHFYFMYYPEDFCTTLPARENSPKFAFPVYETSMLNWPVEIGFLQTSVIELIAVAFGLVCVWSMKKESILAFPFGIVNVTLYAYICFESKLYAYSGINMFYAGMSVYGWFVWTRENKTNEKIRIARLSKQALILNILAIVIFFIVLRILLVYFTDSVVPTWDAATTAIYIVGMWLLAWKKIENWIAWIIGDVISIGLFAYEKLYFSSFQFLVFTIIAILGFFEWRKKLLNDKENCNNRS
jgi:nicotinamide mononucleotide transporter